MKVNFVTISRARMEESLAFYTGILGFKKVRDFPAGPGRRIVFLEDGPTQIELISDAACTDRANGDISIGFRVENVEELAAELRAKGVTIAQGPTTFQSGVTMMRILDPNGVELGFVQE
ncbi:MAG TPA: VOC family protein [Rectinemataceae bacterium]|nr:VOC family protein [Rectinemataceae bacterium]